MVLSEGMAPAWIGLASGALLSAAAARFMMQLVPVQYSIGAATYAVVVPLVFIVNAIAAFLPAWRAARVDPTSAMRCE